MSPTALLNCRYRHRFVFDDALRHRHDLLTQKHAEQANERNHRRCGRADVDEPVDNANKDPCRQGQNVRLHDTIPLVCTASTKSTPRLLSLFESMASAFPAKGGR